MPGKGAESPTLTPQGREIFERLQKATVGKYEIERELGRGGMAVVFLGFQKSLDRKVAIKVLLPLLGYDPEIVERFMREARTQGKLDHPNIIQVFEIYNEGGLTFFTVPYISGQSLRVFMREVPQPPLDTAKRYLCQAADALAYAHRRGVVHRDVKPDNILLDRERDRVILTDFGIAKALAAETTLTTPGDLLGTPQYMSPEQGEGKLDLDGRADQYSLGLIGYEMLAGRRPFQADNLAELMYKHRFEEPTPIHEIRPDAPQYFLDAIARAINKDREARFPTMDAFLAALETPDFLSVERTPPPGSEDATIRVTPRGVQTPPPGALDVTTPDTPFKSPASVPPADTTPPTVVTPPPTPPPSRSPSTPPPSTQPPGTPPPEVTTPSRPAARAAPHKPEVIDPWAADKADSVTPSSREAILTGAGARRPGLPRSLLLGGGALVVLAVGALFLFGPLQPGGGEQLAEDTSGQASDEIFGVPETPGGSEQGSGDQLAGGGFGDETSVDDSGDTAGQPEGGAEGAETGGGGEAEQPSDDAASTGGGEELARREAEQARERARQERRLTAGAPGVDRAALGTLDNRLAAADRDFDARRYGRATTEFSNLIKDFKDLRVSAERTAARNAARTAAESARATAQQQQRAAVAAGAGTAFADDLRRLNSRLSSAENDFQGARYSDAQQAFEELSSEYKGLAARATTELRSRAANARNAMEANRREAVAAGAESQARDRLNAADGIRGEAQGLERRGSYVDAAKKFGEADRAYAQLAADLAAAAAADDEPAGGGDAGPAGVPAETAIRELIEAFRSNFEREDLGRMSSEVYKGDVPRSDADLLNTIFRSAEDVRAALSVRKLDIEESTATADVRLDVKFRQARTGESSGLDLSLRLEFVSGSGGWRMTRARR